MDRLCISTLHKCNTKQNQTRVESHYTKGQCLHVNFSIHKCIQTDFVGGMPQTHVKMPLLERTHSFIQNEDSSRSRKNLLMYVNNENNVIIMTMIKIMQKVRIEVPISAVEGLVQYLRDFLGAKKITDIAY